MPHPCERSLVLDACVLIDFCKEDAALLHMASRTLGRIVVLSPILSEVRQLDEAEVERLNLSLVEPTLEIIIGSATKRGGLSFRDRICLNYAHSEHISLYTNDKALYKAAKSDCVDVRWGLELLVELVAVHQLNEPQALDIAKSICQRSRFPVDTMLAELQRRLSELHLK